MIAFCCATPYQIFNCINLKISIYNKEEADIYLLTYTSDISIYKDTLEQSGIFKRVYVIRDFDGQSSIKRTIKLLMSSKYTLAKILAENKYDILFGTCFGFINTVFVSKLLKNNKDMEFVYYDEGIGIYCVPIYRMSSKLSLFIKLCGGKDYYKEIDYLYAYKPEAMFTNLEFPIKKMPPVNLADRDIYNKIFSYSDETAPYIDKKIIFFDQPFKQQQNIDIDNINIINEICSCVNKAGLIVKKHPTRVDNEYEICNVDIAPKANAPWEVLLLNLAINDKIFISISSTACISPKLIFDEEPIVILLYKLLPESLSGLADKGKAMNEFFDGIHKSYRNKNRFFTPKSFEELKSILKNICGNS